MPGVLKAQQILRKPTQISSVLLPYLKPGCPQQTGVAQYTLLILIHLLDAIDWTINMVALPYM